MASLILYMFFGISVGIISKNSYNVFTHNVSYNVLYIIYKDKYNDTQHYFTDTLAIHFQ